MQEAQTGIRRVRLARGFTQDDIAARMQVTAATVSRWERQPGRVTVPVLRNLARVMGCNVEELLAAEGPRSKRDGENVGKIVESPFSVEFLRAITSTPPEKLRIMSMPTDVMEPTIRLGDLLIVDTTTSVDRNGIYALHRGGSAGVRRLALRLNQDEALSLTDNPVYGPGEVVPIKDLPVIGRVIWRCHRI